MGQCFDEFDDCAVSLQWKKHWFVLSDAGLKYYRDSSAEEVKPVIKKIKRCMSSRDM